MARTHYQILGVAADAKYEEIEFAYRRKLAERDRDDAPPDASDESRLHAAYEALSDKHRRAQYDATLAGPATKKPKRVRFLIGWLAGGLVVVVPYLLLRSKEPPPPPKSVAQDILAAATTAVGRMTAVDIGGQTVASGVAFAIAPNVFLTACDGLSPNVQVRVEFSPRVVSARLASTDEASGLCRLDASQAGASALSSATTPAKVGDVVYAAQINDKGELAVREATVKTLRSVEKRTVIETTEPPAPKHGGAPVLDVHGKVVAVVATAPDGRSAYLRYPN